MGFPYALLTIGCKVNRVEIDSIGAKLDGAGCLRADDPSVQAVFINTCTVTAEADKKTRKTVRHALKAYPDALVFVMGCAVAIDPEVYTSMSDRVRVVAKGEAAQVALDLLGGNDQDACAARALRADAAGEALRVGADYNTRVTLKVQDGCNNACTYCIVHVARGKSVSVPLPEVVEEARRYGEAGVKELVLSGINLASYDWEGADIADLMQALLNCYPGFRIRLGSVEPLDVTDKLIALMAANPGRICWHLHLPLQSGSTKVLSEMDRRYSADFYVNLVAKLRSAMPTLSLSTDIIVGFPGETDEDFADTLQVAKDCAFSRIHVFRYSRREGTPAAERPDQVPSDVSAKRSRALSDLARALADSDRESRAGTQELVLVEADGKGMTDSYHGILLPSGKYAPGQLVSVCLPEAVENGMYLL
ncbi:MAG: MiaB/RimO family radical SAM methylthiotransferase [Eggerthellales bacterium]|nr:MiaB/RimO family radical SAM methylthiotransferase [Eggerthellales bacterium]